MAEFYAEVPARLSLADVETRRLDCSRAELRGIIPAGSRYVLVDEVATRRRDAPPRPARAPSPR